MNVDQIIEALNRNQVAYLLIGGMNFLLRHQPVLTFDDDMLRCQYALEVGLRKHERMETLKRAIGERDAGHA